MDIKRPTAVVLEGGGAKGAYTAAVLKVLSDRGANIVAVAGASAGALNAVALGVGRIDDARRAWEQLTTWHLLSPHDVKSFAYVKAGACGFGADSSGIEHIVSAFF